MFRGVITARQDDWGKMIMATSGSSLVFWHWLCRGWILWYWYWKQDVFCKECE